MNLFIGTGVLSVPTSATNSGAVYLLLITLACGEEKGAGGCMWWCSLWCARRDSCAGGERLRCASTTNIVKRVVPAVSPGVDALVTGAAPGSYKSPFFVEPIAVRPQHGLTDSSEDDLQSSPYRGRRGWVAHVGESVKVPCDLPIDLGGCRACRAYSKVGSKSSWL